MAVIGEGDGGQPGDTNPIPGPGNPVVTIFILGDGWVIVLEDGTVFTATDLESIGETDVEPEAWQGAIPLGLPTLQLRAKGGEIDSSPVAACVVFDE